MARIGSIARDKMAALLSGAAGVSGEIAALAAETGISLSPIDAEQVVAQNVTVETAERSSKVKYPVVYVYTDRIENQMREKFRTFSGTVRVVAELRISHEHLAPLERDLQMYLEAITSVLSRTRGDWGNGLYFTGAYEIQVGGVKPGGRNFIQVAKVQCEVDVSIQ
ncbi:MAG TPA: hypothetical protein DEH78_13400 [Solibacterales bacterium]|nr:hypothetical protein [Bryobacterales bacterium]